MSKKEQQFTEEQKKQAEMAVKILDAIQEGCFDEDANFKIKTEDVSTSEGLKRFLHALATMVPTRIYDRFTNEQLTHLKFNHVANQLIVENAVKYGKIEDNENTD